VNAHPHEATEVQGRDGGDKLVVRARSGYYTSKLE